MAMLFAAALLWCVVVLIPSIIVQSLRDLIELFNKPSKYEAPPYMSSFNHTDNEEDYDEEEEDDDHIDEYDDDPANW